MKRGSWQARSWAWVRAVLGLLGEGWRLVLLIGVGAALIALGSFYLHSGRTVYVQVNGQMTSWRTHKSTPEGVLGELPVALTEVDSVTLPDAEAMLDGYPLILDLARRVRVAHDGSVDVLETQTRQVGVLLDEADLVVGSRDCIELGGQCLAADDLLPLAEVGDDLEAVVVAARRPIDLTIRRARQITVIDGGVSAEVYTTATTVGETLAELGIVAYEGDQVLPDLSAAIVSGLTVTIARSLPVTLLADGQRTLVRTRVGTVGELLAAQGVALEGSDYVEPGGDAALVRGQRISVVRVYDEYYVEETPIAYETRWEPNNELEIDEQQIVQWGSEGARRRQVRVHYENGEEVHRVEEVEWVAREPVDRVIDYGTKIVLRELETASGTVTYWRKLRMLATSYDAPTAGKPLDHPDYGITRTGLRAAYGIIAVDPRVIPLGTDMYVPGYGKGSAQDTGGAILWRRIDLCYDDYEMELWYQWVDVYLLTPVPDASDITWVVPNTPKERE